MLPHTTIKDFAVNSLPEPSTNLAAKIH